ncbi:MAG: aquaporin family protein [SAR202 cluster bacterium]|nr:aquaporin family protein [SAR202 cluster bacterium]
MIQSMAKKSIPTLRACLGEALGTYLLVLFGTGAVAASVYSGAQVGLWQVAAVWGFGVSIAIYVTAAISGAHLNPAVTLAFAIFRGRDFPFSLVLPYWAAQLAGAVLAGLTIFWTYGVLIERFEAERSIVRGESGSELSAMGFGEYFPNPALFGTGAPAEELVSPLQAAAVEGFGTAILVIVIFAITDRRNFAGPGNRLGPFFIGFTLAVLISLFAPLTQAGWNPARDFGPRIVAYFAGWGDIAIPGPRSGFWVYIIGPLAGGLIGAIFYDRVVRPVLHSLAPSGSESSDGGPA